MENIYLNNPEPDDIYDGPSDEELKRIEEELEEYFDQVQYLNIIIPFTASSQFAVDIWLCK